MNGWGGGGCCTGQWGKASQAVVSAPPTGFLPELYHRSKPRIMFFYTIPLSSTPAALPPLHSPPARISALAQRIPGRPHDTRPPHQEKIQRRKGGFSLRGVSFAFSFCFAFYWNGSGRKQHVCISLHARASRQESVAQCGGGGGRGQRAHREQPPITGLSYNRVRLYSERQGVCGKTGGGKRSEVRGDARVQNKRRPLHKQHKEYAAYR